MNRKKRCKRLIAIWNISKCLSLTRTAACSVQTFLARIFMTICACLINGTGHLDVEHFSFLKRARFYCAPLTLKQLQEFAMFLLLYYDGGHLKFSSAFYRNDMTLEYNERESIFSSSSSPDPDSSQMQAERRIFYTKR